MELKKYFTTVTTLSKTLAIILFIISPFIGFSLGVKYQKRITILPVCQNNYKPVKILQPTSLPPLKITYKNDLYKYQVTTPDNWYTREVELTNSLEITSRDIIWLKGENIQPVQGSQITINAGDSQRYRTLDDYIGLRKAMPNDLFINPKFITVGGYRAIQYDLISDDEGYKTITEFIRAGITYTISIKYNYNSQRTYYLKDYNEMLKTFSFYKE